MIESHIWRGIGWALLLSAIIYFSYSVAFYIGYNRGIASVTCGQAQCMEYTLKAEVACYKRTAGWYK